LAPTSKVFRLRGRDEDLDGGLIHHFKLYTEGYHVPAGEVTSRPKSPKGEFGVYLVARRHQHAVRCKIRPTGFRTCRRWTS
jgi:NADH-quinone oxidoreductase subunit D